VGVVVPLVDPVTPDELPEPMLPLALPAGAPLVPVPVEPMELVPPDAPLLLVSLLRPVLVLLEPVPLLPGGLVPDEELVVPVPPLVPGVPPPPCLLQAVSVRAATTASTAVAVLVRVVFIRNSLKIVRYASRYGQSRLPCGHSRHPTSAPCRQSLSMRVGQAKRQPRR
jgi:hypothetical protein